MPFKSILRFGMLSGLLSLLWLAFEFMFGLHDAYIDLHPYVTMFGLIIPVGVMYAMMKKMHHDAVAHLNFMDYVKPGLALAFLMGVFAAPMQLVFHYVINPDFFENMISHALANRYFKTVQEATAEFNFNAYLLKSVVGTFVFAAFLALLMAFLRSRKHR